MDLAATLAAGRLSAQLLAGARARDPVSVVERLLAVQAQDLRGARLAVRARSTGLSAADLDRALTSERTLLITWLNRGTLQLVRTQDYVWLQALTAPRALSRNSRRLHELGVSPTLVEQAVAMIEKRLYEEGPLTRAQLSERMASVGLPAAGQALYHLLMRASLRGMIVRGPLLAGEHAYVLVRDWLGEQAPVDRDRSLAELARRYLAGHGPAGEDDLAKWAGLPLRDVRFGLSTIASELVDRPDGLLDLKRRSAIEPLSPPRLLGPYEPLLMGWRSRDFVADAARARLIVSGGLFRSFALVAGRAAGIWSLRAGKVELAPFDPLASADRVALERDGKDVMRFLDYGA
jgi:hypothetical protein